MTTIAILDYSNCTVYIEQFDETKETDDQYISRMYNPSEVSWMTDNTEDEMSVWDYRNAHNPQQLL